MKAVAIMEIQSPPHGEGKSNGRHISGAGPARLGGHGQHRLDPPAGAGPRGITGSGAPRGRPAWGGRVARPGLSRTWRRPVAYLISVTAAAADPALTCSAHRPAGPDLALVKQVSDRVAVMYLGRLCEIGPVRDIYREPLHPYTLALLNSIPQKVRMQDTQGIEQRPAATAAPATGRPPFRADHVGSLLRPPDLLRARDVAAAGRISGEELRAAEDTAIREVVRRQQGVGLASATDGELRRESWHMDFIYQLGGIKKVQDDTIRVAFHNKQKDYEWAPPSAHVVAPLTLERTIFGDAFTFLADTVQTAVPKLTIPSLSMVHYRGGRSAIDESVYPDLGQFWADLAAAYAEEVQRLYELGCRYLQLDDTSLAYVNDPAQRRHIAEIGGDPEHQHEQYIANINRALAGRPPDLAVTTHMCRGNNQSMWAAEGSYDFVAEALFNDLDVDGFFCEWDDERSGGFEPLRFVPKGKRVVLGLVTTKRGELESKDELKRRIDAAARFVDIDQLCLSPQCGFSSTKEGNDITPDQQWAKLALIVETAQEVWGSL